MKRFDKAQFISFEGLEGCGKSTQSKMLHDYLLHKSIQTILTREVGGTVEAEKIRHVLVYSELLPMSELFLVMAARYEHLQKVILPALKDNIWVICDRFIDSTACYQGQDINIGFDRIYKLHEENMCTAADQNKIMPDITIWIDLPVEVSLNRTKGRVDNNKFEDKDFIFHQKVYNAFEAIHKLFPDRIIRIKAEGLSTNELHKKIVMAIFGISEL